MAKAKLLRLRKPVSLAPAIEERRGAPRAQVRVPIRLSIPSVDAAFDGEAMNISQTGLFIATRDHPPLGTLVDVEITLATGALLLHSTGEIVRHETWREPLGIGIRLDEVSYEAQALIDRMLSDEKLFGRYRLEELVGKGGMGEVYRARVLDGPYAGRTAAIKRLRSDLALQGPLVDLFAREATLTMALEHPNIVQVFEIGKVEETSFIAMDYVNGCNLNVLLKECRRRNIFLPLDFAVYVAKVVADALEYVHTARDADGKPLSIIHRDVAPGNIFISNTGEIQLGDFGVAVSALEPCDRATLAGKDPYLSPESLMNQPVHPGSDVFALGAVLYELCTNRRAFLGSRTQIWKDITAGRVVAPSEWRPDIPKPLERVILQALSPRFSESSPVAWRVKLEELLGERRPIRFASAAAFAAALEPLYDDAIGNQMAIASVVRNLLPHTKS